MEELTGRIKEVVYYANGFGVTKLSMGRHLVLRRERCQDLARET